jgi:hypothetical protein
MDFAMTNEKMGSSCIQCHSVDGKKHDACVVIPVINEGNRIVSLLTKMNNLNISGIADIIIVDGGSTDGSLETENLLNLTSAAC